MSLDADQQASLSEALSKHVAGYRALASVDRLTAGASLETYRLEVELDGGPATLAMRRTPGGAVKLSASWTPRLETEAQLMLVAREHDVPGPKIHFVLEEVDNLGHGFVMEWLEGETLGRRIVQSEALAEVRPRLAYQCGEILARIHSIDVAATGLEPLLHKSMPEDLITRTVAQYEAYDVARPMLDYTARWLLDHIPRCDQPRLVHNDFRNGNLIVSPNGIVGVLDWEHAFLGDPMRDLGWVCNNSWRFGRHDLPVGGFGTYEDLFAGYEATSGIKVDPEHVRFWELFGSFWWAVGCMELANQHRLGMERSVERLAIGRRVSECEIDCVNILIPGPVIATEPIRKASEFADVEELLGSVSEFLRGEVAAVGDARLGYLAKVAANTLSIVAREIRLGPPFLEQEQVGLEQLLGRSGPVGQLREELAKGIRSGTIPLDQPGLADHLRQTVAAQIAIDQPRYSGRTHSHAQT